MTPSPVFVALDTTDIAAASMLARDLAGLVGGIKLGLEFFGAHGPEGIRQLSGVGLPVFLDLKLHDIPNTVASAVRALAPLAPRFLTIHTSGGPAMMRAAADAAADAAGRLGLPRMRLLGVTVLTSLDEGDLDAVGQHRPVEDQVLRLATLARTSGLDGIVASPAEVARLRAALGPDCVLMIPGIRPAWSEAGDQKRTLTPREAVAVGADHLVIGRPITRADDPAAAARRIAGELAA